MNSRRRAFIVVDASELDNARSEKTYRAEMIVVLVTKLSYVHLEEFSAHTLAQPFLLVSLTPVKAGREKEQVTVPASSNASQSVWY